MPHILGYIFDVLSQTLKIYEYIKDNVRPTHRLADFLIWGEAISRALGNTPGEFMKAWKLNVDNQSLMVIQNNSLAQLLLSYSFEDTAERQFLKRATRIVG